MANRNLTSAKRAKNDEFYTRFADIEKEIEAYLEYDADTFRGKQQEMSSQQDYFPI